MKPKVLVLKTDGINCDQETAFAFNLAGGNAKIVHVNDLRNKKDNLGIYQILAIPGGFSYGDDVVSGKILAIELTSFFSEELKKFIERKGTLIIGICNGFQVLVRTGLLPSGNLGKMEATLTNNDSGHFECRWVNLKIEKNNNCVFLNNLTIKHFNNFVSYQVAHGEGKFFTDPKTLKTIEKQNLVVLRYVDQKGNPTQKYPDNPNGSLHAIAGICDPTGRILGLMPHPERFVRKEQHPNWRRMKNLQPQGLPFFENMVNYVKNFERKFNIGNLSIKRTGKLDVVGFGALNVDFSYEISANLAKKLQLTPGEEIEGQSITLINDLCVKLKKEKLLVKSGGGSAANTIVALARMGLSTGYIGKVGGDEEGKFLLSTLTGVDTSHILKGKSRSGMVFALQTKDQKDRFMLVFPGDNDTIDSSNVDISYMNNAKVIHYTSFVGEQSFQAQIESLEKLNKDVLVSFDGGELYAKRGISALMPFLKRASIIFPSREEVEILTGLDYEQGAKKLLVCGPKIVVVKLSSKGCFVKTKGEEFLVKNFEVEKIEDTIGAGDVFAAGFLTGVLKGKSLQECAVFANRVAAKKITGKGRTRYPNKDYLKYL